MESLGKDGHTSFHNVTNFLLYSTILLRSMRVRQYVDDAMRLKKGTKSKELSSIVYLDAFNGHVKLSRNHFVKLDKVG